MRRSISHPHILCTRDGQFYLNDVSKPMRVLIGHGLNMNGPAVYICIDGRPYYYNAARILYEAFVLEKPLPPTKSIVFLDYDETNIDLDNLSMKERNTVRNKKSYSKPTEFDTWMGPDSIYS